MDKKGGFLKELSIYGVGGVISRFSGVITAPIYTRFLSTEDYGLLDLITSLSAILMIIISMEMQSGYGRSYYEAKSTGRLKKLRGTISIFYLISITVITFLFFLLFPVLNNWTTLFDLSLMVPVVLKMFPTALVSLTLVTIRYEKRPVLYSIISIGNLFLTAFGGVFAVTYLGLGLGGILWSNTITSLIICLLVVFSVTKYASIELSLTYLKESFVYSAPIVPARIGTWMNQYIGRIFIAGSLSLSLLSIYSLALKAGLIMTLAVSAFKQSWSPRANQFFSKKNSEEKFAIMLDYYLCGYTALTVLITVLSPAIVAILAPKEYHSAVVYVGMVVVAVMWDGATNILASGNSWERKTYYNTYGSLLSAILSFAILYAFIERGELLIVSFVLVLASIIKTFFNLITAQRNHYIPYSLPNIIFVLVGTTIFATAAYFIYSLQYSWISKSTALLICGILLIAITDKFVLNSQGTNYLRLLLKKIKNKR